MRLGLMGGTFDPIHYGHLVIAEVARVEFGLERVLWIPSGDPPHKPGQVHTPKEDRYAMVLLATAANPWFEVSRIELERPGRTYTFDTLQTLRGAYPEAELFFITGADAILEILTWRRHEEVVQLCEFIAATRPGYDLRRMATMLPAGYRARIHTLEAPCVDISSTLIRSRLEAGEPVRYLLPEEVETYVRKRGLYGAPAWRAETAHAK